MRTTASDTTFISLLLSGAILQIMYFLRNRNIWIRRVVSVLTHLTPTPRDGILLFWGVLLELAATVWFFLPP